MTDMKQELIGLNVTNLVAFVLDLCENNVYSLEYPETEEEITPSVGELLRAYNEWCRDNDNRGSRFNKRQLMDRLTEFGINRGAGGKIIINRTEILPLLRDSFSKENMEYTIA
jgi:phage/plasmid-associated DNA primase